MISIYENMDLIVESIPWRSGQIDLAVGRTTIKGNNYDCFLLNDLKFFFKLNPTFMFCVPASNTVDAPPFVNLKKPGSGANGYIVVANEAQNLGYSKDYMGTCRAKTYFMGRKKEGRFLDILQRVFERGFSIDKIKGIKIFNGSELFEISCKKADFSHSSMILGRKGRSILIPFDVSDPTGERFEIYGKAQLIPARISRVK